tara:strand:- start:3958 stop:4767 length:810 start_codon:yes stop_codon:yes gene_type:complete
MATNSVSYYLKRNRRREIRLEKLEGVRIVLVEPASSGNIGAVARVMKNTGLGDLTIVNPKPDWDSSEARALAHGAGEILDGVTLVDQLESAVAHCHIVVGTTHRLGKQRDAIYPPEKISEKIRPILSDGRIAVVFGREKDGLGQNELRLCQYLLRFPSAVSHPSYNLSHAVLLFAYALFNEVHQPLPLSASLVPHEERERLFSRLEEALNQIGFKHYNRNPRNFNRIIRRFFNKVDLDMRDVRVILKICNQIRRFSLHGESSDQQRATH